MESRWYLLPGQTLENTKINDRSHALHIAEKEWKKITGHLDRKKLIADALEQERAHKQALKEGNDAMIKNWPDSIEHVHMHKENERRKQAEELDRQRMDNYYVLRKEQADIKDAYIKKVKRAMFYSKCYPKNLNGALLFSECLYEREKQLEFKKMIEQHRLEEERKYAESVKKAAEDEKREKEEKAKQIRKKNLELKEVYQREMREKQEAERKQTEARKKQELIDNENARLELELEKQIRLEDQMLEKAERKKELEEFANSANEYKKMLKKETDEIDEVIQVFSKAKHEIECLRQEKVLEFRQQELARREAASRKAIAAAKAKDETFERILKKAQEEADAKEEAKNQQKLERQRQLKKDREEDRKNYLEKKADYDRMVYEEKKWEMLNRLKTDEATKEYNQKRAQEKWDSGIKYRNELLKQIEEDKKRKVCNTEQKLIDEYTLKVMKENDDDFFLYANTLIDYTKENNRNPYPIERVVDDYRRENLIDQGKRVEKMCIMPDGSVMHGNVRMVNVKPGKMAHDPREDPNYRRCPCHKEEMIK